MMEADPQTVGGLWWAAIGPGIISLLVALGLGNVVLAIYRRRTNAADKSYDLSVATQGKLIDADQQAFAIVAERLRVVEERLDKLQAESVSHMQENAKLVSENEWFKRDAERREQEITKLEAEVKQLREDRRSADLTIAALRREVDQLKVVVAANGLALAEVVHHDEPVKIRLVDEQGKDK